MSVRELLLKIQSWLRKEGIPTKLSGNMLLAEHVEEDLRIPIVVEGEIETGMLRVAVPTNLRVRGEEALEKILIDNFMRWGPKVCIDTEGFIAVVFDVPIRCVEALGIKWFSENIVKQVIACFKDVYKRFST